MKETWERQKYFVKTMDGFEYSFVTEYDSIEMTLWQHEETDTQLKIFNENGSQFIFPKTNIKFWLDKKNEFISHPDSLQIKQLSDNVLEINDYIEYTESE